jgi:hypothetical protein
MVLLYIKRDHKEHFVKKIRPLQDLSFALGIPGLRGYPIYTTQGVIIMRQNVSFPQIRVNIYKNRKNAPIHQPLDTGRRKRTNFHGE